MNKWLISLLIDWLIDWFIDWYLVDWLIRSSSILLFECVYMEPVAPVAQRYLVTLWHVGTWVRSRQTGFFSLKKPLKNKIKMPNGWRTIKSLVHKIRLHSRRGKGMAESFSREKLRHAPQKEGGWEILCDLPPVWPRLVRPTNLMSRMNGKKTHTHIYGSLVLSSQPQSDFLPVPTCKHGDCSHNFRRYISSTSCSLELTLYRLPSSRLLAIRARVGRLLASPYPLTLLFALLSSLISSIIRTSHPILPPRLSVGGGRTVPVPVYSRGSPRPVYFHRSPGLPYIYGKVVTARAYPSRPPLAAVPDRSKGVVPSNGVDGSRRTPQMASTVVERCLKWRRRRLIDPQSDLKRLRC